MAPSERLQRRDVSDLRHRRAHGRAPAAVRSALCNAQWRCGCLDLDGRLFVTQCTPHAGLARLRPSDVPVKGLGISSNLQGCSTFKRPAMQAESKGRTGVPCRGFAACSNECPAHILRTPRARHTCMQAARRDAPRPLPSRTNVTMVRTAVCLACVHHHGCVLGIACRDDCNATEPAATGDQPAPQAMSQPVSSSVSRQLTGHRAGGDHMYVTVCHVLWLHSTLDSSDGGPGRPWGVLVHDISDLSNVLQQTEPGPREVLYADRVVGSQP